VDERVEGPAPIYDLFRKYNVDPLRRLLPLAKEAGVRHAVVLGSYFAYFERTRPEMELAKWHPYIRSRRDQERVALSCADARFDVAVLELPYIFGTQPGRKPVWVFLVQMIRAMRGVTFYPRGGTAMVTVRQVAQAVAGALERNRGGRAYPIGYFNLPWRAFLKIVHRHLGMPGRRVITIPNCMFSLYAKRLLREQKARHIEGGLNLARLTPLQCAELFIDKSLGCDPLGVTPDDLDAAIGDSIRLSVAILDRHAPSLDMKGE
jgi:nucleoside-diphosphate-sugar epimerase